MLRMLDVSPAGILDTHLLFSPPFFLFYVRLLRSEDGAQEQKIPGVFFDVEILDGQELIGGSQVGGLAFSIALLCLC